MATSRRQPMLQPDLSPSAPSAPPRAPQVRRTLFQAHLSRRPPITRSGDPVRLQPSSSTSAHDLHHSRAASSATLTSGTGSASSSASTLVLGRADFDLGNEIVVRDSSGDFQIGDPVAMLLEGRGEGTGPDDEEMDEEDEWRAGKRERQLLNEALKQHMRDRNRRLSEPAELLEAVKAVLRANVARLGDDDWMYDAEESEHNIR